MIFAIPSKDRIIDFSKIKQVSINDKVLSVKVALDDASRTKGLGGVQELSMNEGMLFVFNTPGNYRFWMKDMYIPIDMIWIDQNFNIVHIEHNVLPETFPNTFGLKEKTASFVLEVFSGVSTLNNFKIGDKIKFLY